MSDNLFINYRRGDTIGTAGRLFDRLANKFGRDRIFMDVDGIPAGVDFAAHLSNQVRNCKVLLALIGPGWLDARDQQGRRRLEQSDDYVAIEIASALQRDIVVIPVLIDGAKVPSASELPETLRGLSRRNAVEIRNTQFSSDADRLIAQLQGSIRQKSNRSRIKFSASIAFLTLVTLSGGYLLWQHSLNLEAIRVDQERFAHAVERAKTDKSVLIGAADLGFGVDQGTLRPTSALAQVDRFRLRILKNDIFVKSLSAHYSDGSMQDIPVGADLRMSNWSDWYQVDSLKFVQEIKVNYRSRPNFRGKVRLEAYGILADGWIGNAGRGRQFNDGWVLLTSRPAEQFSSLRTDAFGAAAARGVKKIRVQVEDRELFLDELAIVYANGERDAIPFKDVVRPGKPAGPFDLKGGDRMINSIHARYMVEPKPDSPLPIIQAWAMF